MIKDWHRFSMAPEFVKSKYTRSVDGKERLEGEINSDWIARSKKLNEMGLLTIKRFKDKTKKSRPNDRLENYTMEPFIEEEYDENGILRSRSHKMTHSGAYADGEYKEGLYEEFDEFGRKIFEAECYDDAVHGDYKLFFPDGRVMEKGTFGGGWGDVYIEELTMYHSTGEICKALTSDEDGLAHLGELFDDTDRSGYSKKRSQHMHGEKCLIVTETKDKDGDIVYKWEEDWKDEDCCESCKGTRYYKNGFKRSEKIYDGEGRLANLKSLTVWDENGDVVRSGVIVDDKFVDDTVSKPKSSSTLRRTIKKRSAASPKMKKQKEND